MAKVLKVYTLYTDEETMAQIITRLVKNSVPFHSTGEYLYSNTPWDNFLLAHCKDLTAPIALDCERWSEGCLNFEGRELDEEIELLANDERVGVIRVSSFFYPKVKRFLSKIIVAAGNRINAQSRTI